MLSRPGDLDDGTGEDLNLVSAPSVVEPAPLTPSKAPK